MASVEVKKRDYNVLAGETHAVQARSGDVVTSQPSGQSGIENYILDLDAQQVSSMNNYSFLISASGGHRPLLTANLFVIC